MCLRVSVSVVRVRSGLRSGLTVCSNVFTSTSLGLDGLEAAHAVTAQSVARDRIAGRRLLVVLDGVGTRIEGLLGTLGVTGRGIGVGVVGVAGGVGGRLGAQVAAALLGVHRDAGTGRVLLLAARHRLVGLVRHRWLGDVPL